MQMTLQPGERFVPPDDPRLQYAGRVDFEDPKAPVFLFTASSVAFRLTGRTLRVALTNTHHLWENRLGVVINGKEFSVLLQEMVRPENPADLPECFLTRDIVVDLSPYLTENLNEVLLFKRQDSCHQLTLHGLALAEGAQLLPPPARPARRLEFYGDSVSAGEITEAEDCAGKLDPPDHNARFNNAYLSYAWQTARLLNAEISDIAQGGIALQDGHGYFFHTGMLSVWDQLAYNPFFGPLKAWDFRRYRPHVVVVAIGQNDSAQGDYMHTDYAGAQARQWRADYRRFVLLLREKYPRAHIVLTTTIMCHSAEWDEAIEEVCAELRQTDPQIHHFLYSQNGSGTPGHVRGSEAAVMARELAAMIETLPDVWADETEDC